VEILQAAQQENLTTTFLACDPSQMTGARAQLNRNLYRSTQSMDPSTYIIIQAVGFRSFIQIYHLIRCPQLQPLSTARSNSLWAGVDDAVPGQSQFPYTESIPLGRPRRGLWSRRALDKTNQRRSAATGILKSERRPPPSAPGQYTIGPFIGIRFLTIVTGDVRIPMYGQEARSLRGRRAPCQLQSSALETRPRARVAAPCGSGHKFLNCSKRGSVPILRLRAQVPPGTPSSLPAAKLRALNEAPCPCRGSMPVQKCMTRVWHATRRKRQTHAQN
jgi:hypothetical protein